MPSVSQVSMGAREREGGSSVNAPYAGVIAALLLALLSVHVAKEEVGVTVTVRGTVVLPSPGAVARR